MGKKQPKAVQKLIADAQALEYARRMRRQVQDEAARAEAARRAAVEQLQRQQNAQGS